MAINFLRLPEVERRVGFKRAKIYAEIKAGRFPAPVKLGPQASGWVEEEVEQWQLARIAEREKP